LANGQLTTKQLTTKQIMIMNKQMNNTKKKIQIIFTQRNRK